jgi:hypothetical protein
LLWIERRLCLERELACDESVVRSTKSATTYASCLTSLAEKKLARRAVSLTLAAWEGRSSLARRVHLILGFDKSQNPRRGRALLGTLALGTFAAAVILSGSPQLVSFSAPDVDAMTPIAAQLPYKTMYREAVFHPGAARVQSHEFSTSLVSGIESATKLANKSKARAAVHQRHNAPINGPQGWLVVTRWSDAYSEGATYTLINFDPRLAHNLGPRLRDLDPGYAAYAPAPNPASWIVIQL